MSATNLAGRMIRATAPTGSLLDSLYRSAQTLTRREYVELLARLADSDHLSDSTFCYTQRLDAAIADIAAEVENYGGDNRDERDRSRPISMVEYEGKSA